jgi:DNA repair protein SbcD/Mre11
MARVVALGDAHLGRQYYSRTTPAGANQREHDFEESFEAAVDLALSLEPDVMLWLGDLFDHPRPGYRAYRVAQRSMGKIRAHGAPLVAISGNHDTPRLRGTGSPYATLEEFFPTVTFAWRMEAVTTDLAGVRIHAVPQTLSEKEFKDQLDCSATELKPEATSVLIAHVALTSLPSREWKDINELEIQESAFDRRFDRVLLGHYHVHQKASRRTWYAGSTDSFSFADRPKGAGSKGLVVLDTETGSVEHHPNLGERPLETYGVDAAGLSPSELIDACGNAAHGSAEGAVVRLFLNETDPAAFRQMSMEDFREAVPGALHVQAEADYALAALPVQGGPHIGRLEAEWDGYVEGQDLAGLERDRVRDTGRRFLEAAQAETV